MAVILVNRPTVEGDRVYFSWTASKPLEKVKASKVYFEYVGLPVGDLPIWVHLNTLVGLLLSRLVDIPERHLVVLDCAVPRWVIDLWGAYHAARNVRFVADDIPADGANGELVRGSDTPHFGVLFGGGKDSLFALDLIREAFPEARVSLISYSIPAGHGSMANLEQRRASFALNGAAENYGASVLSIRTDARAVFESFFHTELYTASLFPILHIVDLSAVTFSYEYCHYWSKYADGKKFLSFRRSRPEHCAAISRAYSRALGRKLDLFNSNGFMTELSSFLYLARKRADFASEVMMCESTDKPEMKWCGNCTKCMEYSLFSAYAGITNADLPISDFLADSPWVSRIIPVARKKLAEFPEGRSKRWFTGLTFPGHFDSFSHVIGQLSSAPPSDLEGMALENLRLLADAYGQAGLEVEELAYEKILEKDWPEELRAQALSVVRSRIGTRPNGPSAKLWGNSSVVFEEQVVDEIPGQHIVDFGVEAFSAEIVSLGARLGDGSLFRQVTLDCLEVRPVGDLEPSQLMIARCPQWIDVHSKVGGPKKGDGFSIRGRFPSPINLVGAELCLRVSSPYFSDRLTGWCGIRLRIDKELVLDADLADFGGSFFVAAPARGEALEFFLEVVALRDCENWSWGRAMRVCLEQCGWHASQAKRTPGVRLTYPDPGLTNSKVVVARRSWGSEIASHIERRLSPRGVGWWTRLVGGK